MPVRVPKYEGNVAPIIRPGNRQRANYSPDEWGAGVAREATDQIQDFLAVRDKKVSEAEREEKDIQAESSLFTFTRAAQDQVNSIMKAKSEMYLDQSLEYGAKAVKDYDSFIDARLADIGDPGAKIQAQKIAIQMRANLGSWNNKGDIETSRKIRSREAFKAVETLRETILNDDRPEAFDGSYTTMIHIIEAVGGPEMESNIHQANAEVTIGLVSRGRSGEARAFLNSHRDQFDPKALPKIEQAVADGQMTSDAKAIAAAVFTEYPEDPTSAAEAMNAAIENIGELDGYSAEDVRKNAEAFAKHLYDKRAQEIRLADEPRVDRLELEVLEGSGILDKRSEDWIALSDGAKSSLSQWYENRLWRLRREARVGRRSEESTNDRLAKAQWRAMQTLDSGDGTPAQESLDVFGYWENRGVSDATLYNIRGEQKKLREKLQGQGGISYKAFEATVNADLMAPSFKGTSDRTKRMRAGYRAYMNESYWKWKENFGKGGVEPQRADIEKMRADWLSMGEQKRDDYIFFPSRTSAVEAGGQFTQGGKQVDIRGSEPLTGYKVAPIGGSAPVPSDGKPAAGVGTIRARRTPNGKPGYIQNTPEAIAKFKSLNPDAVIGE